MPKLRIERIIEVKERIMDDKRKEMESVVAEIEKISNEINDIENEINANYDRITSVLSDSNDIYVIKEYIIFLDNKKLGFIKQREELRVKMDGIRTELIEMVKEIKMLEILKSKELKIIKKSQDRREQKLLDELAARIDERR